MRNSSLAGLAGIDGLELDPAEVETNMVRFRVRTMPAAAFVERMLTRDVLVLATGPDTIRAVTNLMVSVKDIDTAVKAASAAVSTRVKIR